MLLSESWVGRKRVTVMAVVVAMLVGLISASPRQSLAKSPDSWTGADKGAHLAAGMLLSGASYAMWVERRDGRGWGALLGVGVGLGAGAGKELADLAGLGNASAKDFAWTALGTVLGVGLSLLIDVAIRGAATPHRDGAR